MITATKVTVFSSEKAPETKIAIRGMPKPNWEIRRGFQMCLSLGEAKELRDDIDLALIEIKNEYL